MVLWVPMVRQVHRVHPVSPVQQEPTEQPVRTERMARTGKAVRVVWQEQQVPREWTALTVMKQSSTVV